MLTYDFTNVDVPIYEYLYRCIKNDILAGNLKPGDKLPSKRSFAHNHGISTITIQNAYDQLISEGYVNTLPRKGYYVAELEVAAVSRVSADVSYSIILPGPADDYLYDISSNGINPDNFPFSVWAKTMRYVMSEEKEKLMEISPSGGVRALREAIASHLQSFRGMLVDPDQIVIGAGTEYLYGILVQLLGKNKRFVIENPGYKKLVSIYQQWGVDCGFADMDSNGASAHELSRAGADVAHICPNHHFPTGITMPASRRYEILSWANEKAGRYILEDDYDSEFRASGRPVPTLFSIDGCERVIYMNTFSKSLSPTIRISYMVLPIHLATRFYQSMSFQACTVSNFEQYTLARFIQQGSFEKHINRMRLYYIRQRKKLMDTIRLSSLGDCCRILENDSGLHFLLQLKTTLTDAQVENEAKKQGLKIKALSDYYLSEEKKRQGYYLVNYSNLNDDTINAALKILADLLRKEGRSIS